MLKTLSHKAVSFIKHLRAGTVRERIAEKYHLWRQENFWLDYPGKGEYLIYSLDKEVRIHLYRDDRLSELIYKGDFEKNELNFMSCYLKPGMIFFDVGANIGLYSLIAANLVGPAGSVYCFEPASKTYKRLVENVQLNGFRNVFPKQAAVSNREESRQLTNYAHMYSAWNSLGGQIIEGQRIFKENVECIRLDRVADDEGVLDRINMIKIDVEGWEWYVLRGGEKVLKSEHAPDLLVEFSDLNMNVSGTSAQEIYQLLLGFGFDLFRIDSDRKQIISEPFLDNHPYDNYFCTRDLPRALHLTGYSYCNLYQ